MSSSNKAEAARKLANALKTGKSVAQTQAQEREIKQKKPEFKAPRARPRPFSPPARGPKSAQRGRSPERKPQASRGKSESPFSRKNRGQAMKDRSRSRSRSASITREPALPTDPQQLAELEAFKQRQQEPGNSWNVMDRMPKSRMSQDEKKNLTKQLAEEDKGRQKIAENDKRRLAELEANSARLEEREKKLQRQQAELDRKQAEFKKQQAEAELKLTTALVTRQRQPNAYTTRVLAAQGPGVGPGVGPGDGPGDGPRYEKVPPSFFNPPDPGDPVGSVGSVSRLRAKSPEYATAEGKKKKNKKRSVKKKKGNKKKKKGGKVSKKN